MGLVFIDFFETNVRLDVNGSVQICLAGHAPAELNSREYRDLNRKSLLERWLVIDIDEAYIHCSKHVPLLEKVDKRIDWGTDDPKSKSDDFFLVEGSD